MSKKIGDGETQPTAEIIPIGARRRPGMSLEGRTLAFQQAMIMFVPDQNTRFALDDEPNEVPKR